MGMYGRNPQDNLQYEAQGKEFERGFIIALKRQFKDNKTYHIETHTGTDMDTKQGTDFTCADIRIDPTLNFSHKNYMPYIMETDIAATPCQNFKMGIRHGNHHEGQYHGFDEPVVVIGIDMPPEDYKVWQDEIFKNIEENAFDIIENASIALEDYMAVTKEDREDLIDAPLKKNPNYRPPKNPLQKYANIEKFRAELENQETENSTNYEVSI